MESEFFFSFQTSCFTKARPGDLISFITHRKNTSFEILIHNKILKSLPVIQVIFPIWTETDTSSSKYKILVY